MQKELTKLYESYFFSAAPLENFGHRCSAPLLIGSKYLNAWQNSNKRILIIGQETLRWHRTYSEFYLCDSAARITGMMQRYDDFDFAKNESSNRNSPFWQAFRMFGNPADGEVLWSNVFRMSVDGGSVVNKASAELLELIYKKQKGLLSKEIQILQPTAIIFFTGPNYDSALKNEFNDIEFYPVEPFKETRQFARVTSAGLGLDKPCFRTYHPAYLRRTNKSGWLEALNDAIHVA